MMFRVYVMEEKWREGWREGGGRGCDGIGEGGDRRDQSIGGRDGEGMVCEVRK